MKPRRNFKSHGKTETVVKVRRAPGTPTKSQLRAAALAEARTIKARWQKLIGEAQAVWSKLHAQELARVDGNFHVLAGLVQMRYRITREETDRQVQAFFNQHLTVTAPAPVPTVRVATVVAAPAAEMAPAIETVAAAA
ncbi:MAG: hypothetical protein E6R07_07715 [Nevskiaceae bacterium]|nr:MAG: hypothetical protein E6R07_07715 [Nevskiaceae bacterium]